MENFESINQTFKAMRELPLKVSFSHVKKWVNDLPEISRFETPKTTWSFLKSMFPPTYKN